MKKESESVIRREEKEFERAKDFVSIHNLMNGNSILLATKK